jgi:predicted pyridoxine 5'-phosphate oxidase superfamily flavin-nucleotide-binding protein
MGSFDFDTRRHPVTSARDESTLVPAVQRRKPNMLTPDMKRIIEEQLLGFVATTAPDGTPSVSPKATFFVVDDNTIAFGEIRSPGTIRNLRTSPRIEINFVDPFVRKGYRFAGTADVVERGSDGFDSLLGHYRGTLAPRLAPSWRSR